MITRTLQQFFFLVGITISSLGVTSCDSNGYNGSIDGFDDDIPIIEAIEISRASWVLDADGPNSGLFIQVNFEAKNVKSENICIPKDFTENEFSTNGQLKFESNKFALLNQTKSTLIKVSNRLLQVAPDERVRNTLHFGPYKKNMVQQNENVRVSLVSSGRYCDDESVEFFPVDFILKSGWIEVKGAEKIGKEPN